MQLRIVRFYKMQSFLNFENETRFSNPTKYLPTPFFHSAKSSRIPEFCVRYIFHTRIARLNFDDRTIKIKLDILSAFRLLLWLFRALNSVLDQSFTQQIKADTLLPSIILNQALQRHWSFTTCLEVDALTQFGTL
jgi:hypothetical protein